MNDDDEDISSPFNPWLWLICLLIWACFIGFGKWVLP